MADEQLDKSEDATPYKLDEARKKGQIGRSLEFTSTFGLVCSLTVLCVTLPAIVETFRQAFKRWFSMTDQMANNDALIFFWGDQLINNLLFAVLPAIFSGLVAAIVASLAHSGPVFSFYPLKPDLKKINPANGLKKIFSRRSLVELVKLILKICFFACACYLVWIDASSWILNREQHSMSQLFSSWFSIFKKLIVFMLVVFIVFALFDLWYTKKDFARQMRMSRRDLKDEYKQREGNPEQKSKRRKIQLELVKKMASLSSIKDADVIITNPTHIAVALHYRPRKMALPIVTAKGKGFMASLIRRRAGVHNIQFNTAPTLARKLFADVEIREPIPLDCQEEVAGIYRELIKRPGCKVLI